MSQSACAIYDLTGPPLEAARSFVLASGQYTVTGSLDRIDMLAGSAGTPVCLAVTGGADTP